jgi:hypothetical protein
MDISCYLLQRKIWRDKNNINMTMNGGQIRFYLRIYCRTLGILWDLCPFELVNFGNFPKFTTGTACQCNSSETIEQIWCAYYLPSFMKFCSVVSEELHWQAASVVNVGKCLSSKGHNSHKFQEIRKFWSPEFCGSYAPLNLEISRNLLLKQLVSATPLKLLNKISWNLVGIKDTICIKISW